MNEQTQKAVLLHLPKIKKIDIEFDRITFCASDGKKGKKQILKGVCGKFKSGELTAIMGPSGAGKTSLLNILTGFQSQGMKGTIKSSGSKQNREGSQQYKKDSCYILQDDQLAPYFTVSEIMNMAAHLKLGQGLSEKAKQFVIDDVLDMLGLMICKQTRCNSLSGGQKKRLSIALELINNPPIMFLDEPTTGLDSSSSYQCVAMLKSLARGGRTIVCTIHQPSASIYEMFDHVYGLAEGHCIYQGASFNTVPYLSSVGLNCPEYHNPADYLLEVANGEYGHFTEQLAKAAEDLSWRGVLTSSKIEAEEEKQEKHNQSTMASSNSSSGTVISVNPPSEWQKFWILVQRSLLQFYRDWTVTHLKLFIHTLVGIFIGLFYFDIGNDASKIISNFGYMIVSLIYLCYTSMMPAVLRFPSELPVLRKERFNNWYRLKTYYAAFTITGIPMQILFCTSYTAISYFMSSQPQEWSRFLMFLSTCCLVTLTAESAGIMLGTTVNPINGTFLGAISIALMISLAGFLAFLTHMAKPFYFLSFISYIRYGAQGLVHAVYGYNRGNIPCPEEATYCHYTSPDVFLKEVGMLENTYWLSTGVLIGMIVFLRVLAYCTLRRTLSTG